jgi:hypothetical protein
MIEDVYMSYYSDAPGISLYTIHGMDSDGLTLYWCSQGTNNVEGGVHQNIVKCFRSCNASPRFAVNLLCDYALWHNLKVNT